jgi:hypothetical protein
MMVRLRSADPSAVGRQSVGTEAQSEEVQILQLPTPSARAVAAAEGRQLSQVLFETAGLLAESLECGDAQFKDEVIDLAVRSLRVAGTVIERRLESTPGELRTI